MSSLGGRHVFLSAGFPSGARGDRFLPCDPGEIADAVTAIVRAVLKGGGKLLFGGHPAITPLVLMIARELSLKAVVDVFQSRWFEDETTSEMRALAQEGHARIHWTAKGETRTHGLREMRRAMFSLDRPIAGVFIGGMNGVRDEFEQFGASIAGAPRIALAAAGGAAGELPLEDAREILGPHARSKHYPFVASLMVEVLAKGLRA